MTISQPAQKPSFFTVAQDGTGDYNGTTEVAIQAAITAAIAAGSKHATVLIKKGTYTINNTITCNGHLTIKGEGTEYTELRAKNSLNAYILVFNSTNSVNQYRVNVEDIKFDGNMTNQSSGGCILGYGLIQSRFWRIHCESFYEYGLHLWDTGGGSGTYGHHNHVFGSLFDSSESSSGAGTGIYLRNNDENTIISSEFQYNKIGVKDETGFNQFESCSFVDGETGIYLLDCWRTRVINCIFDYQAKHGVHMKGKRNLVNGCTFYKSSDGNTGTYPNILIEWYGSCSFTNNIFIAHEGGAVTKAAIEESGLGDASQGKNIISGNQFLEVDGGSYSVAPLSLISTDNVVMGNRGDDTVGNKLLDTAQAQFSVAPASSSFAHLATVNMAASATEQHFNIDDAANTAYDSFMLVIRMKTVGTGATGKFGVRVATGAGHTQVTSGYKNTKISYSTLANPNEDAFYLHATSTGDEYMGGTLFIKKVHAANDIQISGTIYGTDQQVFLGGRVTTSANITRISFKDYEGANVMDGSVEIYGFKV